MRLREKQFKKQMDSKRKIEGDGFSTVKETHKTSVKGKCNDGARCCAGTPCFFLLNFVQFLEVLYGHGISYF